MSDPARRGLVATHPMLQRLIWLNVVLSFALITLGGVVHNTESSLACPDWPLCFGQVLPEMKGGVAIEHSHRLLATFVGMLTIATVALISRQRRRHPAELKWAWAALILVLMQGALGGLTVLLKLPTLVSTAHLATSMAYFCVLLLLAVRTLPATHDMACNLDRKAGTALGWLLVAGVAVYVQMILGALVRHTGSGAAVGLGPESVLQGFDLASGQKDFWPADGPGRLHMAHRFLALGVLATVAVATHFSFHYARARRDRLGQRLALAALGLTLVQIALGVAAVWTFLGIPQVTAHLSVAAAILAVLIFLRMRLARVPVNVTAA